MTKPVKVSVKLTGGTLELTQEGIIILNAEVDSRSAWYAHFDGKAPKRGTNGKYTPAQQASLNGLEKAKRALVVHVGAEDFRATAALIGYQPHYVRGKRA